MFRAGLVIGRKSVPIILMQDVWNLGKKGDVVTVRPGYMRNCLVFAVVSTNRIVPREEGGV